MRKRKNLGEDHFMKILVLNIRADSSRSLPSQAVLLFYSHASVGYTVNLWYR